MVDGRCAQCGQSFGMAAQRQRVPTATGRVICRECADALLGAAAGVVTAKPTQEVANAVSVSGWFARLRRRRRGQSADATPTGHDTPVPPMPQ